MDGLITTLVQHLICGDTEIIYGCPEAVLKLSSTNIGSENDCEKYFVVLLDEICQVV